MVVVRTAYGQTGPTHPPHRGHFAASACRPSYWQVLPRLRQALFSSLPAGEGPGVRARTPARPGYVHLQLPLTELKATILGHPEFTAFQQQATRRFTDWRAAATPRLKASRVGARPARN